MIRVVKWHLALVWTEYSYQKRKGRGEDTASGTGLSFLSSLAPQIPWLWAWVNSYSRYGRSDPPLYKLFFIPKPTPLPHPGEGQFLSILRNVGWCTADSSIREKQTPRCPFQLSHITNRVAMSRSRSHRSSTFSLCMLIGGFTSWGCASAEETKEAWERNREEWSMEDHKVQK